MADEVEFNSNLDEVLALLSRATESALEIVGGVVEDQAGEYVMAAKGPNGEPWPMNILIALRQSITHQITEGVLYVGTNMQVGPYIELGTGKHYKPSPEWLQYHGDDAHSVGGLDSWLYYDELEKVVKIGKPMKATPYLRPAFLDHVDDIKDVVKKELENAQ